MKVLYKNKKVEKLCTNEQKSIKELGKNVSDRLLATINLLKLAKNLKDIKNLPQYHLHLLTGNLKNIFSIYLGRTTGYRLLLTPLDDNDNPIVEDKNEIYIKTVCVEIIEVSKHYE